MIPYKNATALTGAQNLDYCLDYVHGVCDGGFDRLSDPTTHYQNQWSNVIGFNSHQEIYSNEFLNAETIPGNDFFDSASG